MFLRKISAVSLLSFMLLTQADACTRLVYLGKDKTTLTARSMDWKYEMPTKLWILPRGMERNGEAGPESLTWKSKYGSVVAVSMDAGTSDGMNEKGLVANALWLKESTYPSYKKGDHPISLSLWTQYMLDNFATVDELVQTLAAQPLVVLSALMPGLDQSANIHLAISDASGDSAIIEYVDGIQVIYHSNEYQVLTNSPTYANQLAINSYWKNVGALNMLPGTNKSSDRFARASFYVNAIPQDLKDFSAVTAVSSVIRNASVPVGISTVNEPEIASTRWRTISDQKELIYYFDSVQSPNMINVDLKKIDFATSHVKKLDLGENQSKVYVGNVNDKFSQAKMFTFLPVDTK